MRKMIRPALLALAALCCAQVASATDLATYFGNVAVPNVVQVDLSSNPVDKCTFIGNACVPNIVVLDPTTGLPSNVFKLGSGGAAAWNDSRFEVNILTKQAAGATTWDAALAAAMSEAATRGGGTVIIPNRGTCYGLTAKVPLVSNVDIVGTGKPCLSLTAALSDNFIEGTNYASLTGGSSSAGISHFGLHNLIIDAGGFATGHCVAFWGRDFDLGDLTIQNCGARGLSAEYAVSGGTSPYNGHIHQIMINGTGQEGFYDYVSDAHVDDVNVKNSSQSSSGAYDGMWFRSPVRATNLNAWSATPTRYAINATGDDVTIFGVTAESAATASFHMGGHQGVISGATSLNLASGSDILMEGAQNVWVGNTIVGGAGTTGTTAVTMGASAGASASNRVDMSVTGKTGALVDWTNSGGFNTVTVLGTVTSAASPQVSTRKTGDRFFTNVSGGTFRQINGGMAAGTIEMGDGASAQVADCQAIGGGGTQCTGLFSLSQGFGSFASSDQSTARGFKPKTTIAGERAESNFAFAAAGDAQSIVLNWYGITTTATPTEIFAIKVSNKRAILPDFTTWDGTLIITGTETGGSHRRFSRKYEVTVQRDSGVATTAFTFTPTATDRNIPAGFASSIAVDTTNGSLNPTVTGVAGATVNWHAEFVGKQMLTAS